MSLTRLLFAALLLLAASCRMPSPMPVVEATVFDYKACESSEFKTRDTTITCIDSAPAFPETRTIRCWTGEGTKPADDCTAQLKAAFKKGWRLVDVWHKHENALTWYEFTLEKPEKEKR